MSFGHPSFGLLHSVGQGRSRKQWIEYLECEQLSYVFALAFGNSLMFPSHSHKTPRLVFIIACRNGSQACVAKQFTGIKVWILVVCLYEFHLMACCGRHLSMVACKPPNDPPPPPSPLRQRNPPFY